MLAQLDSNKREEENNHSSSWDSDDNYSTSGLMSIHGCGSNSKREFKEGAARWSEVVEAEEEEEELYIPPLDDFDIMFLHPKRIQLALRQATANNIHSCASPPAASITAATTKTHNNNSNVTTGVSGGGGGGVEIKTEKHHQHQLHQQHPKQLRDGYGRKRDAKGRHKLTLQRQSTASEDIELHHHSRTSVSSDLEEFASENEFTLTTTSTTIATTSTGYLQRESGSTHQKKRALSTTKGMDKKNKKETKKTDKTSSSSSSSSSSWSSSEATSTAVAPVKTRESRTKSM